MKLLAQNPVAYLGEVEKTSKAGNKVYHASFWRFFKLSTIRVF